MRLLLTGIDYATPIIYLSLAAFGFLLFLILIELIKRHFRRSY